MNDSIKIGKDLYRLVNRSAVTISFLPHAVPLFEADNPLPQEADAEAAELAALLSRVGEGSEQPMVNPDHQDPSFSQLPRTRQEGSDLDPEQTQPVRLSYAWMRGALPAPNPSDCYVVQFRNATDFVILGYIDRFGRVFSTKSPMTVPPACYPSLAFAKYAKQPSMDREVGCVQAYDRQGNITYPAEYRCENNRYTLYDSWFDFSAFDGTMLLDDALARAFLAFVHRPRLTGSGMPERGFGMVRRLFSEQDALSALELIESETLLAEDDPAMRPPALMSCLARWLQEAGLQEAVTQAFGLRESQLRVAYPTRYAKMIFVDPTEESILSDRICWQIQSALNRYLLVKQKLADEAADAALWQVLSCDQALRTTELLAQAKDALHPVDENAVKAAGEWSVRSGMARDLEAIRSPYRFEAEFRADVSAGVVAFDLLSPDVNMMPLSARPGSGSPLPSEKRQRMARDYAMTLGVLLAASAFHRGRSIQRVAITAFAFSLEDEPDTLPMLQVVFDRQRFGAYTSLLEDSLPDLEGFYALFDKSPAMDNIDYGLALMEDQIAQLPGFDETSYTIEKPNTPSMVYELSSLDPFKGELSLGPQAFDLVKQLPSDKVRYMLPGQESRIMSDFAQTSLGCTTTAGLSVNHDARYRYVAEQLSEKVALAKTSTECIRIIRATQEESDDPSVLEGCNRLMAALAQDQVDPTDQNQVVSAFLGRDRFLDALVESRAVGDEDPRRAMAILREVVDEALDAGVFKDTEAVVHRVFDSTTSRLVYNLSRKGILDIPGLDLSEDEGKSVELAPDSFYYCLVDLVRLAGMEFTGADKVMRYGKAAITMAPTMAAGYRQVARGLMLSGDLGTARSYLVRALRFALHPSDIGMSYYQLGYIEWKSSRYKAAMACYCKAMAMFPELRMQVFAELRQMLHERRMHLMEGGEVDVALAQTGIPVAPNSRVLDALHMATAAIVDEGLFPSAQNVLSTELHYRPNDALSHVLRSLD
ncbi:MAG: hypothetical protein PUA57_06885 [Eggerthellales bacterium]|nr:hypothetical protein [Eggerthellales bacterium]